MRTVRRDRDIYATEGGLDSSVQQHQCTRSDRTDHWLQIMGPAGEDGLDLSQDARVKVAHAAAGTTLKHTIDDDRAGYLYVMGGAIDTDGDHLDAGDAIKIDQGPEPLSLTASETAELILVDAPATFRPIGVWAR